MKRVKVRPIKAVSLQPRWARWSVLAVALLVIVPTLALGARTKYSSKSYRPASAAKLGGGLFELDGNIAVDQGVGADDWLSILGTGPGYTPPPRAELQFTTGVLHDSNIIVEDTGAVIADNIFTGGSTGDLQDIAQLSSDPTVNQKTWLWAARTGGPDKDDIQNSFSAIYKQASFLDPTVKDTIIYAGGDRYDNSGDAQMGFWFLQEQAHPLSDGHFHTGITLASPLTRPEPR